MSKTVNDMRLFLAEEIAASGNAESSKIDLAAFGLDGYFGCQVTLTGDGTAKVQVGVSIDGTNFIYSDDAADDIITAHTKTSGPGSDGKDIYSFSPVTARWLKIKVTETGGGDSVTVTLDIAMQ